MCHCQLHISILSLFPFAQSIFILCERLHSRWSRNGTIAKILEAMKKQKLLNEEDYIFFIDSTSIKMSPDAHKSENNQTQSISPSKVG